MSTYSQSGQFDILEDIDLHDALIDGFVFDAASRTLDIDLHLYESADCSARTKARIRLEEVRFFSSSIDAMSIKDNARAGNVASWKLVGEALHIYLVEGLIRVEAGRIHFQRP